MILSTQRAGASRSKADGFAEQACFRGQGQRQRVGTARERRQCSSHHTGSPSCTSRVSKTPSP
jgi:hypothetical protein